MPNERSYETAVKRSNQIHADLAEHPENYVMLTGDRPTGRLHLGHYFLRVNAYFGVSRLGSLVCLGYQFFFHLFGIKMYVI